MSTTAEPGWHARSGAGALTALDASTAGLGRDEARRRLARHGRNRLPAPAPVALWQRMARQFSNVLLYVLLLAAVITGWLGEWIDTAEILGVVVINAVIGFIQEGRAEAALAAIRSLLSPTARVLRDGSWRQMPADEIVPGDLVRLRAGDRVPADLRLLEASLLEIDEAALTGESLPVGKTTEPVAADAPLAERVSMAFAGTLAASGAGTGLIVATGLATELGRISGLVASVEPLTTPLLRQIGRFSRQLTVAILGGAVLLLLFAVLFRETPPSTLFLAVVGFAVAAIPEGLPAVMTIALALGVRRMACRHAIVHHLPAIETLGSVTVICTDKTGTLTRNELAVARVCLRKARLDPQALRSLPADLTGLAELVRVGALCNEGANAVDTALLDLARHAGIDPEAMQSRHARLDLLPFASDRKLMASLHSLPSGTHLLCVKGAPEQVVARCVQERRDKSQQALVPAHWTAELHRLADDGDRVIALASATLPATASRLPDRLEGLVLEGLIGLSDPPCATARAAVQRCRAAGITVKMITGDHPATAGSIARTTPAHKLRLVRALQAAGEIVAMTGDGVNDAPALRQADIGVAMGGKGTEAAKEAAEMVLADDDFSTIEAAVAEGRTIYDNLRKTILLVVPTSAAMALTTAVAIVGGTALPVTPTQILWLNMVTATTLGLALAFERADPLVMTQPPRASDEPLLFRLLAWRTLLVSIIMVGGVFGLFGLASFRGTQVELARTAAVNALVAGQIGYLWSCRSIREPCFGRGWRRPPPALWRALAAVLGLQLAFTHLPPLQLLFHSTHLTPALWAVVAGFGMLTLAAVEAEKLVTRRSTAGPR